MECSRVLQHDIWLCGRILGRYADHTSLGNISLPTRSVVIDLHTGRPCSRNQALDTGISQFRVHC